jgi:integrase/recombinase XerD
VGKVESIVRSWQSRLRKPFNLAKASKGHGHVLSHRFRDTFSVELLLAGVPIERFPILLAHQNVRITEKHYSPCDRSLQEQLEQDLRRVWDQDAIALMGTKGTPEVHGERRPIN